jgi:predicted signal transduction protein with EAL and GGDEF domain
MPVDALIDSLPDLVVLVRRDGVILSYGGGLGLSGLRLNDEAVGKRLADLWPETVARLVMRLASRAIATRAATEARFEVGGMRHDARLTAQGPDRTLCVIRTVLASAAEALDSTDERPRPQLDRRGFLRRFKDSLSLAVLSERPAAVVVIHLDGVTDIAQGIDAGVAEHIMSMAILRLPPQTAGFDAANSWYVGQLGENVLSLVLEMPDRDAIEVCVARLCDSLRETISIGDADFQLTPYAGVAILGVDAASPKTLLAHARAAANHARTCGSTQPHFFTDTVRLGSLARLDMARELREAIARGDICLRYTGRYDLATGRLVAWVGYLRWIHPIRGEVRPAEFLRVAESTGLAAELSRGALKCLQRDFAALAPRWDSDVQFSFGALRHHVLHENFAADIAQFLSDGAVPAQRLELRIAEKAFVACIPSALNDLGQLGVRLVVDEVGRGLGSLDGMARTPIWGLQLDRAWVTALRSDDVALKVCRAGISMAVALGLTPIATGVDDEEQRQQLLALGCRHGSGDLYQGSVPHIKKRRRSAISD